MVKPWIFPLSIQPTMIYLNYLDGDLFIDVLVKNNWIKIVDFTYIYDSRIVHRIFEELKERVNEPW